MSGVVAARAAARRPATRPRIFGEGILGEGIRFFAEGKCSSGTGGRLLIHPRSPADANIEAHTFAENKEKFDALKTSIPSLPRQHRPAELPSADPALRARSPWPDADGAIAQAHALNKMNLAGDQPRAGGD